MECLHVLRDSDFCNASVSSTKTIHNRKKLERIQDMFVLLKLLYFCVFILRTVERLRFCGYM